jgi:hypothetical protein
MARQILSIHDYRRNSEEPHDAVQDDDGFAQWLFLHPLTEGSD